MGGGGSPAKETQTSELPAWAKPYFTRLLGRAETDSLKPYEAYTGDRLVEAGDNADISTSRDMIRDVASGGISGLDTAQDYANYSIDQAKALGQYSPTQGSEFQFDPTRQFDQSEADKYMSPYMQNVVNKQSDAAISNFNRQNASRAFQGVGAGAFGGSRQGVVQGMAEEGLMGQLDNIQAKGLQDAYTNAQTMFGQDRSAQTADQTSRAAENTRLDTLAQQENQFGAGQGLAALATGASAANDLVALGKEERGADIQGAQLLEAIGKATTAEEQQVADMAYQDWVTKQGYDSAKIGNMSNILQGLPVANAGTSTTVTQAAQPSFGQQVVGAGLQGLSLYNAYSGM
tara:strand:- start:5598 stop:6635 length:1038 start_codon:yes stop_codon:yes gene_type:complete